ncbi:MAG: ribonuclease PH [Armatimonadetes bacterium]|jgi:ribonuclease PH|nr:ribonuclease PH [Armatimonadota bacterium]MDI9603442.1 ribonuclease PH [Acidobacteriota bacterium]NLN91393.1 ribonuclease PH [candidate division WS1 bacterium]
MNRPDGRAVAALRPVKITRSVLMHPEGSCLIEMGNTHVLCTATVEETVPRWMREGKGGWVTAEYGMLPRSTNERIQRGRVGGRGMEIQRLIGRALRAITDTDALGERCITVDCDVLQADGGTRCASVTGGFVALVEAMDWLRRERNAFTRLPLRDLVAAVSVGVVQNQPVLDLCYAEDFEAQVDMNVVATGRGLLVEVQGTAEGFPFTRQRHEEMLDLAMSGVKELVGIQREVLGELV